MKRFCSLTWLPITSSIQRSSLWIIRQSSSRSIRLLTSPYLGQGIKRPHTSLCFVVTCNNKCNLFIDIFLAISLNHIPVLGILPLEGNEMFLLVYNLGLLLTHSVLSILVDFCALTPWTQTVPKKEKPRTYKGTLTSKTMALLRSQT